MHRTSAADIERGAVCGSLADMQLYQSSVLAAVVSTADVLFFGFTCNHTDIQLKVTISADKGEEEGKRDIGIPLDIPSSIPFGKNTETRARRIHQHLVMLVLLLVGI